MDLRLKQRLIGAGVLVIAVVWLVPELFDSEEPNEPPTEIVEELTDEFSSRIVSLDDPSEEAPQDLIAALVDETEVVEVNADEVPVNIAEIEQTETQNDVELAVAVEENLPQATPAMVDENRVDVEPAEQIPIPRTKPGASENDSNGERLGLTVWAIQLGSFAKSENALGLRDRLREKGYTAFVQTAYPKEGAVTRVFVGPELYREEADSVRDRLHSETTLDGLVVRYPGGEPE